MTASLIQRQQECIDRMLEPRTSEKRAAKNRSAALKHFQRQSAALHYFPSEIAQQVRDIKDMVALELNAEEA